jgi:hypothetical protein
MAVERLVLAGVVKNGVILPEGNPKLPEGTRVEIIISGSEIPPICEPTWTYGSGQVMKPGR